MWQGGLHGGDMCCWEPICREGGHAWWGGGMCVTGGMCGRGMCGKGMCGGAVCGRGCAGGMHGRGHAWWG